MSETPSAKPTTTGHIAGWIKAGLTSLAGLVSGAVLMYASPLLDRVIKPDKPIANFQYSAKGLVVTFQNHSTGGHEGWWDFGDGAALQPFVPGQPTVAHTYAKPGNYNAKLSLRNLINAENERAVNVVVDPGATAPPAIDVFTLVPVQNDYAPATFRAVTKVTISPSSTARLIPLSA